MYCFCSYLEVLKSDGDDDGFVLSVGDGKCLSYEVPVTAVRQGDNEVVIVLV
jgi:hypothetical protein